MEETHLETFVQMLLLIETLPPPPSKKGIDYADQDHTAYAQSYTVYLSDRVGWRIGTDDGIEPSLVRDNNGLRLCAV